MPYIIWKPEYNFNIKIIDDQHHALVDTINLLFDSMQQGKTDDVLASVFANIISYVQIHFKTEETFMNAMNFPDALSHKQAHEDCKNKVLVFKARFDKGEPITIELFTFLGEWLHNHLLKVDMKYRDALKASGLAR